MHHANPDLPYLIQSDASLKGLSAVLLQKDERGGTQVIATASRGLRDAETRYYSSELEIAAVYFALQKFRQYIFQKEVTLQSDHMSLSFINRCRLTSSRLSRWIHEIAAYDVKIEHIKGSQNILADALSRNPLGTVEDNTNRPRDGNEVMLGQLSAKELKVVNADLRKIAERQRQDPILAEIISSAKEIGSHGRETKAMWKGMLYRLCGRDERAWKAWVPKSMVESLIKSYHEELGHLGSEKLILMIEQHFYLKHLGRNVRKIISRCELCQRAKPMNRRYEIDPQSILRDRPRALITADVHGEMPTTTFGNRYLFVVYDAFTKFVRLYPMRKVTSQACVNKIVKDFVPKYGPIEAILTDNATIFTSKTWEETLKDMGTKVLHSSKYYPQGNPAERILRDIGVFLRIYCHKNHKNWYRYCEVIERIINSTISPITGFSPLQLMTGVKPPPVFKGVPPLPGEEKITATDVEQCAKAYERMVKRNQKRREKPRKHRPKWEVKVGDKVLLREHNLSSKLNNKYHRLDLLFSGPYEVTKILGLHTYELISPITGRHIGRYHKSKLRPYKE